VRRDGGGWPGLRLRAAGVFGVSNHSGGYGVYGKHESGGIGVYGTSASTDGVKGTNLARNTSAELGTVNAGIEAHAGASGTWAGAFQGDVLVHGDLSVIGGTKNFKIDHPLDPANRYLYHASVESSEVLNTYSGNVILDERGEAVVDLPAWFEAINRDVRYQLTAVGAPGPSLHVAEKVKDNRFRIAGGAAGMEVSWQLTALRSDAWMLAHPFVVEQDKAERSVTTEPAGAPLPR